MYHTREALWAQPWSWNRNWLRGAAAHNTLPAMIARGAAMVAGQAVLLGVTCAYGAALTLWLMGVTA